MTDKAGSAIISNENAVNAALSQNWPLAVKINTDLLKNDPHNTAILNRLGYAYVNIGKIKEAQKIFLKVKKLDPYNIIAEKNLKKLEDAKYFKIKNEDDNCDELMSPLHFIEEPGITKIVTCINTAPKQTISSVRCGQEVFLNVKNHVVEVRDTRNKYLAALPDDLSFRLNKLIAAKNKYRVFIKNVDKKNITIFIREVYRGKKFINQPSFISKQLIRSYTRDPNLKIETIEEDKPDTRATGEEDADE